jgi:hypothetical protein
METGKFCVETGHHAVQFYGDDASLSAVVADYLAEGLRAARPAVVIATPEHRTAIGSQLDARGIDVDACIRAGALRMLDAEETLAQFMVDGAPDPARFKATIEPVLAEVAGHPRPRIVRAYGEMVDVLWRAGHADAAIQLEVLWNELAMTRNFALLCGYHQAHVMPLGMLTVCNQHTHVLPGIPPAAGDAEPRVA